MDAPDPTHRPRAGGDPTPTGQILRSAHLLLACGWLLDPADATGAPRPRQQPPPRLHRQHPLGCRARPTGLVRHLPARHPVECACVFTRLPGLDHYTWQVEDPATGTGWTIVLDAEEYRAIMYALDARPWRERRGGGSGYLHQLAVEVIAGRPPRRGRPAYS